MHFSKLPILTEIIFKIRFCCQFVSGSKNARSFLGDFGEKMVITFREIQTKKGVGFFRIVRNIQRTGIFS